MKTAMTSEGIGPKLIILSLPYVILSIIVMNKIPEFLNIEYFDSILFKNIGIIWFAQGIAFWISSEIKFLRDFKLGKLITHGTYGFFEIQFMLL